MIVARHPGARVHAVGDVPDRHGLPRTAGPELAPDMARDLAVLPRDAVDAGRAAEGGDRHVELVRHRWMPPEGEEALPFGAE